MQAREGGEGGGAGGQTNDQDGDGGRANFATPTCNCGGGGGSTFPDRQVTLSVVSCTSCVKARVGSVRLSRTITFEISPIGKIEKLRTSFVLLSMYNVYQTRHVHKHKRPPSINRRVLNS